MARQSLLGYGEDSACLAKKRLAKLLMLPIALPLYQIRGERPLTKKATASLTNLKLMRRTNNATTYN